MNKTQRIVGITAILLVLVVAAACSNLPGAAEPEAELDEAVDDGPDPEKATERFEGLNKFFTKYEKLAAKHGRIDKKSKNAFEKVAKQIQLFKLIGY